MSNSTQIHTKLCTNCNIPQSANSQDGNYIDDGISINVNHLGHYGGFTDNFPGKTDDYIAHLCHDCCVILSNALPGFAAFAQVRGGHGNITGRWTYSGGELSHIQNGTEVPPCCQYAWTWDKTDLTGPYNQSTTYLATPQLTWEKLEYDPGDIESDN